MEVPPPIAMFYEAMQARDAARLCRTLADRFVVVASAGMPLGVGGEHQGPDRAIRDLWAVVHEHYDVAPVPERAWVAPDGTAVVHGWYEGSVRRTGEPVRAEFVHLLEVADDRLVALRQVTDTVAWRAP